MKSSETDRQVKYYIGIDGGGTKTKFLAGRLVPDPIGSSSARGPAGSLVVPEVAGECTLGACHYMQIGFDGVRDLFREGIDDVCAKAGIVPGDVDYAFAGVAAYGDVDSDQPMLDEALRAAFGTVPFDAGNDCENALAGALAGRPGINIIAGTGSIGSGRDADGRFMRCGGWHYALGGDEGSAYWIAWSLLKEYARQSDGRDKKTLLYDAVNQALDLHSDDEMVTRVVTEWGLDRTRIAGLAPVVSRLWEQGDPYAVSILTDCAKELADLAIALRDRLRFGDGPVPVSGTGGVFSIDPAVTQPFARILRAHGMEYVAPIYPPDMGALLLAANRGSSAR